MNFTGMIGKAALMMDWEHHTTSMSEEIKIFATIFPKVCPYACVRFVLIFRNGTNNEV